MIRTIYFILMILLLGCDAPNNNSVTNSNSDESKLFVLSVLDDMGDTIVKNFSLRIKLPLDTTFMGPVPHVISFAQLEMIDSLIVQEDMASIGQVNGIRCVGDFVRFKRRLEMIAPQKFKANYVQDLDWTKVNANQVNCIFEIWGNYGQEYFQAVSKANQENKTLAEFHYQWTETNRKDPDFFEHANDSVFRVGFSPSQYFLTWGDEETEAFRIIDEGVIGDLNGDGIADRLLRYSKQGVAGVCGLTRKQSGGSLEFFKLD
jgi:hypothetical protein